MANAMRPGLASWLRDATADERMFVAEVSIMACNAAADELVRLALSLDLTAQWGERTEGLRQRVLWRARYYHRIRHVEPQPPVLLSWWARLVGRLPTRMRPAARRFIDGWRFRERP